MSGQEATEEQDDFGDLRLCEVCGAVTTERTWHLHNAWHREHDDAPDDYAERERNQ